MAEIRLEERGRGLGWIWALVALVLVALLIWYFNSTARRAEDTLRGDTIGMQQQQPPPTVAETGAWRPIATA
ncbi:MAG TPA: hypothetical protein VMM18_16860 [Gemmatimonadaceae bacterium]|nr:hypothetical protein [Gemmatimonadaceae bacterium]